MSFIVSTKMVNFNFKERYQTMSIDKMNNYDFGIVGLGVMGRNLLLNIADNGFAVAGLDLDPQKAESLEAEVGEGHRIKVTTQVKEFIGALQQPRAKIGRASCRERA